MGGAETSNPEKGTLEGKVNGDLRPGDGKGGEGENRESGEAIVLALSSTNSLPTIYQACTKHLPSKDGVREHRERET